MVPNGSLPILFDFAAHQPKFTIFDASVRFLDRAFSVSQTFHFAAVQNDSALDGVQNFVLMLSFAIVGHHFVRDCARRFGNDRFSLFVFRFRGPWFGVLSCWLSFFLIQCLSAHVYFLGGELKNGKSLVELILGWIQDWQ